MKKDAKIKGIQVNKYELKISQYADDTTVFDHDLESVTSLLKLLNDFNVFWFDFWSRNQYYRNRSNVVRLMTVNGKKYHTLPSVLSGHRNPSVLSAFSFLQPRKR